MGHRVHLTVTTVAIDKAGRIVIPKAIRDELRLAAGDALKVESDGKQMTLRPLQAIPVLKRERGVWVFYGRNSLSLAEANKLTRDERKKRHSLSSEKHS